MRIVLILFIGIILYSCNPSASTQDKGKIKVDYLLAAKDKFPDIDKYESKIILGHLNDDDLLDAFIQYGKGEGIRPVSQQLIMLLKDKENKVAFYPIDTDYCPSIDTIKNKKLIIEAYDICFGNDRNKLAQLAISIKGSEIKEDTLWTYKTEIIDALVALKKDLANLPAAELRSKYQLAFTPYCTEADELIRMKDILSKVDLSKLKNRDTVEAEIETPTLQVTGM